MAIVEQKIHSQNGEDGVIASLIRAQRVLMPHTFLEIGAGKDENNTLALEERGWTGIRLDTITGQWITAENIFTFLPDFERIFGVLSIDIDGMDFWVLKSLLANGYRPRIVCIEYNAALGPDVSMVQPYDPDNVWNGTEYFGASLLALARLGAAYDYRLEYCESTGVNAFFVRGGRPSPEEQVRAHYRPRHSRFPTGRGLWETYEQRWGMVQGKEYQI